MKIDLDDELDRGLKALVAQTGQAESAHVRAALRAYLERQATPDPDLKSPLELIGLVDELEGPQDVAEEHDHYLYGAAKLKGSR